jgi:hypothetical protein
MFQFPRFPPLVLCVQTRVTPHDGCGVSPFGYPRIDARSTAPRGFSQSPTSFIGSRRQGIHRWLFVAWKSKMLVLAMEFSRCTGDGREAPRTERRRRPAKGATGRTRPLRPTRGRSSKSARRDVAPSKRNRRVRACRQRGRRTNPATAERARGSSSQWSTGCSLEEDHPRVNGHGSRTSSLERR